MDRGRLRSGRPHGTGRPRRRRQHARGGPRGAPKKRFFRLPLRGRLPWPPGALRPGSGHRCVPARGWGAGRGTVRWRANTRWWHTGGTAATS
ncbi:hypothetical protein GAY30_18145 [Azospirillum brasilense]|nr:hypothetical protein [Azospirillum brasilense]NUB33214.1 hypothetical protein [Azospirillum brasilense]RIW00173.1 hypothetical protein D2T81_21640 [Azospirillum brasilense]